MRLIVHSTLPAQEIAAEPTTLARLRKLLQLAVERPLDDSGSVLRGGRGLLSLPLVEDPDLPPLTVHLRPYTTPMGPTA
jgi:hypothetical protein